LAQDVERDLREHFGEDVYRNVIPRTVRLAEAPSYGIPVTDYAPASRGAGAYIALANEVQTRG
jgi:chromosome partitioning protein